MELAEERSSTDLNLEDLAVYIHKNLYPTVNLARIREIKQKVAKVPEFKSLIESFYAPRETQIPRSVRLGLAQLSFIRSNSILPDEELIVSQISYESNPLRLIFGVFVNSLSLQCSDAQLSEWLPKAKNLEIIGCYAQTELAHGSNVRGLETEAAYCHSSKEFTIHSPSISSTKWWIGALGVCANHALLIAQLKINGQSYGPHAFLVPIRDPITHEPLKGVEIGDIGPKMGLNSLDNGYIRFDHYKLPVKYMLNKFSRINDNGEYELIDSNGIKVLYLSMVNTRFMIATGAWFNAAIALTIAIRYSIVRRQFPDPNKLKVERKLLDYQIQQKKLFVGLGFVYGAIFVKGKLKEVIDKAKTELNNRTGNSLGFAHALMALFKVYMTSNALQIIERSRASCGGHGYMLLSGFPLLYNAYLPSITYEGDNSILALQVSKYLVGLKGHKPPLFQFLFENITKPTGDPLSSEFQHKCLKSIAQIKVQSLLDRYKNLVQSGCKKEAIWNDYLQIEAVETAESVFNSIFHQYYLEGVNMCESPGNQKVIDRLRLVFANECFQSYKGEIISLGVSFGEIEMIKKESIQGLCVIRKNALALIEVFEFNDLLLNSTIGNREGNVYEKMYEEAKNQNPVNNLNVYKKIKEILTPKI